MNHDNEISIVMDSKSQNESLARVLVASFASVLDPTLNDINDIKTAVSEAVTNAIIHGYDGGNGKVRVNCILKDDTVTIEICDDGVGIDNVDEARTPLYTSKPDMERSGMGFTVMESFMDSLDISTVIGKGTKITLTKRILSSIDEQND
jgi:stage II sporulation protein AB (anti-sigma F factor)